MPKIKKTFVNLPGRTYLVVGEYSEICTTVYVSVHHCVCQYVSLCMPACTTAHVSVYHCVAFVSVRSEKSFEKATQIRVRSWSTPYANESVDCTPVIKSSALD